ncbi:flagellar hook assembly protein FlgD [Helicobacter pylori]|uniref:flagellar hook assembly protein FlgD n=1 Tax=Helicobacter pylori TaxID=210 RepID=UPI000993BBF6|nr:flagellar hook assembly protein FlgD [Helicobacter pylori]OOQ25070.1 flagellar biosynthesis protein FlgD [Helicobacter pylori]PDX08046.1 flagellar biosynthesis protein FlgD [Helicobacter pylori]WQU47231.1 flagellar hook assembly protein FlgD [Helicobacter pylori]
MAIDLAEVTGAKAAQERKKEQPTIANGLDKNAFMKLFLEQLKNQDPTAPMETDKIITQTAQLTQVEMQEENKKTMQEVASAMKSNKETNESLKDFQGALKDTMENLNKGMDDSLKANNALREVTALNSVSMIGKIAETDVSGANFDGNNKLSFSLFFDEKIDASKGVPAIQILNENNELVKTIPLKDYNGQKGYINFEWDGINEKGEKVPKGNYKIKAEYNLDSQSKQYLQTRIGRGEVESVIFDKGKPMLRMGEMVLPIDSAIEFYKPDQKPLDQKLSDQKPQKLSEQKPLEQKLSDQKPLEQKLSDQKPLEQKLSDQKPLDQKISDQKPLDQKISDQKLSEQKPLDQKFSDQKLSDQKPQKPIEQTPLKRQHERHLIKRL